MKLLVNPLGDLVDIRDRQVLQRPVCLSSIVVTVLIGTNACTIVQLLGKSKIGFRLEVVKIAAAVKWLELDERLKDRTSTRDSQHAGRNRFNSRNSTNPGGDSI